MTEIDPRKKAPDNTHDDDPFEATGQGADDAPADSSTNSLGELQSEPGE